MGLENNRKNTYIFITAAIIAVLMVIGLATVLLNGNTSNSQSTDLLMSFEISGGLCIVDSGCGMEREYLMNGQVTIREGNVTNVYQMTAANTEKLKSAIETANIDEVAATEFTGTCPIVYDGAKTTYTFNQSGKLKTLDSCEDDLTQINNNLFDVISEVSNFGPSY